MPQSKDDSEQKKSNDNSEQKKQKKSLFSFMKKKDKAEKVNVNNSVNNQQGINPDFRKDFESLFGKLDS